MKTFMSLSRLLSILTLFTALSLNAQELSFENGKRYILGGLTVSGLESYNEQTVKTYTGLRVGQPITVPGEKLSSIINKLWGLELFSDVAWYITDVQGDKIFLELEVKERPTLSKVTVYGIKERKVQDILDDTDLKKGKKITESLIANSKNYLRNKYRKEGYLNAKVHIATAPDSSETNAQSMVINIKKGEKVKVKEIVFEGNDQLKAKKLRKALKNTKEKRLGRFWKKSKYIEADFEEDLGSLIDAYAENGYRDARVLSDTVYTIDEKLIGIKIKVEEGNKYYFGDIDFVGNSVYTDQQLARVLGIKKGSTYNGVLLKERIADDSDPDSDDLTAQYQNHGYLFSQINPVEVSAVNDTIDFEIRIIEGKETFLNHIDVVGNDRTNDHVIFRELRTRPGQKYSKADIIRSIRELGQLGFFDAENIKPDILNPDPNTGTVDIKYSLVEAGSSQIELQGGYGGGGFIGTLGLSFNNFSLRNIFKGKEYKPVPMGDGQTLAIRAQASRSYRVYSLNFSEPWLGGKKPVSFSTTLSRTEQFGYDFQRRERIDGQSFTVTGISFGLGKRVRWPDDFFSISHGLSYQLYEFNNYRIQPWNIGNGSSNSLSYTLGISRNSAGPGRIFPLYGSTFSLSGKFTPPYSWISGKDWGPLKEERDDLIEKFADGSGTPEDNARFEEIEEERLKWAEFWKVKFKGEWFTRLVGKLVLRTNVELGFLGSYNSDLGDVPFDRFYVGGDGLGNFTLDGRESIQLRGYENNSITPYSDITNQQTGGVVYNKYSMELRYPLTLKPTASIYTLAFMEAGNNFNNFRDFNPFEVKRSAGVGLRIFMPAFGLLGIDFGYGFDQDYRPSSNGPSGWQTHFIIGQRF